MTNLIIISTSDILVFMLFNLLSANIATLLCFVFLFRVVFNSFFIIPVDIEDSRLKLALAITTTAPITVGNDAIEMLPLVTDKIIKDLLISRSNIFTKLFTH